MKRSETITYHISPSTMLTVTAIYYKKMHVCVEGNKNTFETTNIDVNGLGTGPLSNRSRVQVKSSIYFLWLYAEDREASTGCVILHDKP